MSDNAAPDLPRCSQAAQLRGDPLLGTAPPQRDCLLIEHPGPWPARAPYDTELGNDLITRLGHPARRVVLVRPPGRKRTAGARRWFRLVDGDLRTGTWEQPDDLLNTLDATAGNPYPGPLLLVCAHGVHDACCAISGRPVAAALAAQWPESTFECTHLGGDRFAANLMVLPDLACYGQVPSEGAVTLVEEHLAGRPDLPRLRGAAGRHPAEQTAVVAVLERWGPAPLTAVTTRLGSTPDETDGGLWEVAVTCAPPLPAAADVTVRSSRRAPAHLTCRAERATPALTWEAVAVTEVDQTAG